MLDGTKRMLRLYEEAPEIFKASLEGTESMRVIGIYSDIKDVFRKAEIDEFFFNTIINSLLNGNYDVLYLDTRMVGENKKRIDAQKQLEKIRAYLYKEKNKGRHPFEILFEG